jgi:hypothetical protein
MKTAVLFIVIFGLGALTYALLSSFLLPKVEKPDTTAQQPSTTTPVAIESEAAKEETTPVEETPVTITEDGSLLDGPFRILNKDGEETGATVRIIRSPEETLLQFENWDEKYSPASHVYFAGDLQASNFFNLGPAKMSEEYLVYGIPLDASLELYSYILIYQTQTEEVEYYAKIK